MRVSLSEIMHSRSIHIGALPARVRQWLVLQADDDVEATAAWLDLVTRGRAIPDDGRYAERVGDAIYIWEAHTEFSTITVLKTAEASSAPIVACEWLADMPGAIFRSVEITIGAKEDFGGDEEARLDPVRTVSSLAFDGAARIWSDFTIKDNKAGKIWIEDIGLCNDEASRLVQALLEIGNYRKLALLGFPIARELMPWITSAEARHANIAAHMNAPEGSRTEVLADLLSLSAEVECRASAVRYRLGATASYHLLARDRLSSLREQSVSGYPTWAEFIERRLLPAMRTCEISQQRLNGLSERISRSASLLSLEQTIALNRRSQISLASMNRRAMLQLRLQSLVEGFSIFAISYYIVGLIEHLLDPILRRAHAEMLKPEFVAAMVPVTLGMTWIALRRLRLRANPAHGGDAVSEQQY